VKNDIFRLTGTTQARRKWQKGKARGVSEHCGIEGVCKKQKDNRTYWLEEKKKGGFAEEAEA